MQQGLSLFLMIQTRPREHVQPSKLWKLVKKQTQDLNPIAWLQSYWWHCDIYRGSMEKHSMRANRNGEGKSTRAVGRNHIILRDKENSLEEYRAHRTGGAYKARLRSWAQRITMQSGNRVVTSQVGLGCVFLLWGIPSANTCFAFGSLVQG